MLFHRRMQATNASSHHIPQVNKTTMTGLHSSMTAQLLRLSVTISGKSRIQEVTEIILFPLSLLGGALNIPARTQH